MKASPRRVWIAGLAALALYVPASLAYALHRAIDHNEHLYVAGAVLRMSLRPYADFCWIQTPYWIELESLVFRITGGDHLLLTGRLLNWAVGIAGLLVVHRLARRFVGAWLALGLTALVALNRHFLMPLGEASNYQLSFAAGIAAVWLFLHALEKRQHGFAFASGLLLGVATGAKLYYLAAWPAFALTALLHPRELEPRSRLRELLLPGAAGLSLGLLPMLVHAVRTPDSFWFGNLGYHALNQFAFSPDGLGLGGNLRRALHFAGMPETAALLLLIAALIGLGWERARTRRPVSPDGLLLALLALLGLAAALSPRPIYPQYFLFPLPFALLFAARSWPRLSGRSLRIARVLGALALLAALGVTGPPLARLVLAPPGPTAPTRQEALAAELAALIGDRPGSVATLSPLHALEAGRRIEPELATGPFVYRIAELLSEEERRLHRIVAPSEIAALLGERRPAAILVGEEGVLDDPLAAFAARAGYEPRALDGGRLTLWLRPRPSS